jgi:mRNA interferase RelE/StbE
MYEVLLEAAAERDLGRLPQTEFHRLVTRIKKALGEEPRPSGCRKIAGSKNDWRIRVGTYRVIDEIDEKAKAVKVMRVRHRREAYR